MSTTNSSPVRHKRHFPENNISFRVVRNKKYTQKHVTLTKIHFSGLPVQNSGLMKKITKVKMDSMMFHVFFIGLKFLTIFMKNDDFLAT